MQIKLKINFTNLIGAIAFLWSIASKWDTGLWPSAVLVLGRAVIPELIQLVQAVQAQKQS